MHLAPLSIALFALLAAQGAHAAGNPAAGKEKSGACVACHAADGNSTNPQFPRLAGQHPDYLVKALMDYKSGERKNPIMAPFAANLSREDMQDLAGYFAQQRSLFTK